MIEQLNSQTEDALNALDTENRARALGLDSYIVEAPAGAGKTELLTQRYLKLLALVQAPEEIIALTFTNKAAAEMRNRILTSLDNAQNNTLETAPHKLQTRALAQAALAQSDFLGWNILGQPSRLRILTIDSLCSSLTRQMPLLSAFGGTPAVSDDVNAHYLEAAQRAVADIAHETASESGDADAPVTAVLRFLDNNTEQLTALLADMLAKRDQWLPYMGYLTDFDRHILDDDDIDAEALDLDDSVLNNSPLNTSTFEMHAEKALTFVIESQLNLAFQVFTPAVQQMLMPLARHAVDNLNTSETSTDESLNAADKSSEMQQKIALLQDWAEPLLPTVEHLAQWHALTHFMLTKSGTYKKAPNKNDGFPANPVSKEFKRRFIEIASQLDNVEALASVRDLPTFAALAESQTLIRALATLLMQASSHLWAVFQAAGEVDFVEIAHRALRALENEYGVTDLALALDYQLSHLLIDEFQDTNPLQLSLIERLVAGWQPDDGRTLFCVGDPMQSIYRFRKAEVSIFLQASQQGINDVPLTPLKLSRNNRSQPAVVSWINQVFARVFPPKDAIAQGAIQYRPFTATRIAEPNDGVEIHSLVLPAPLSAEAAEIADAAVSAEANTETSAESNPQEINSKQIEAQYVAKLIQQAEAESPSHHRIAVLVRSRSHLKALVSNLRRDYRNLAFQAIEIEHLNDKQSIQDALSLTYALHHLADRVHWLNVLRAPWCGLSLADLHQLAGENHHATIWQLMQTPAITQHLSAEGQQRLSRVCAIFSTAFATQGRAPVRRWVQSVWLQLGGAQCLAQAADKRDIDTYFDLVEKLSQRGALSFSALETHMEKLYAAPDLAMTSRVQLLTIHKSKGLEFETVIVPALNRKPRNDDQPLVLWQEVDTGHARHLMAAPLTKKNDTASVYDLLKKLEETRRDHETTRLLYVAATRAINKLHLIATVQTSSKGALSAVKKSLLDVLWPELEVEFLNATPLQLNTLTNPQAETAQAISLAQFDPKLQRLSLADVQHMQVIAPTAAPVVDIENAMLSSVPLTTQYQSQQIHVSNGVLAHAYMALMAESGVEHWHAARLNSCVGAMEYWLQQQGFSAVLAKKNAAMVLQALQTSLASPQCAWVLQQHQDAASELALMHFDTASELRKQVIDRTFIADNTRWIIDYKLADVTLTDDLTVAANAHIPQLKRYAALYAHAELPIKTAVFFLSLGRLVEVSV